MEIQLENVSKRFNKEWIFKNLDLEIRESQNISITGPNGSGKSTLLLIIAGFLLPTEGRVKYNLSRKLIAAEEIYKYLSLVSPSMTLPEDFTLNEFLNFHFKFKKLKSRQDIKELPGIFKLESSKNKYIKNFSTGMKQRLKLGVALYADTPLLLLDEPATNLDKFGMDWYFQEIEKVIQEKMIFVCSNRSEEYAFCKRKLNILDYKK